MQRSALLLIPHNFKILSHTPPSHNSSCKTLYINSIIKNNSFNRTKEIIRKKKKNKNKLKSKWTKSD